MKTSQILASLALASTATLAMAQWPDEAGVATNLTRADVKAEVAHARASGQLEPASTYEVAPRVTHRKTPSSELTRAQVREETREYLRQHPNRVADEYAPFNDEN